MKRTILVFSLLLIGGLAFAQLNMQLVGTESYNVETNDIWGWVAPDGTEYALVGTVTGLSIVSLQDPANPTEVAFVNGPNSIWRDVKSWGNYAYVSNETSGGIQIVDLSGLPGTVRDTFWTVTVGEETLDNIHNLYVDSLGFAYVAGSNLFRGGPFIVDLNDNPWDPEFVGPIASIYAHDIYVRGDLAYSSELYQGRMAIYDISDKKMPLLLGTQPTPFNFTHNIWLSDDGTVAFTTDERFTAPVASYDVSDPTNIRELDQFRPAATLAQGNIPHNVHVWEDWLILSYYGDGGIIVDASRPTNLVEVGNFDTFLGGIGTVGAWGAYPYLPSGLVLVTDIENGLFVLEPNYVRAAWLEGTVTEAGTGTRLNGVSVTILSEQANIENTDLSGEYKTGQALAGTFDVHFFKEGYLPKTVSATLDNGLLTVLDVELTPASLNQISGITLQEAGGATIEGAQVVLEGEQGTFRGTTAGDGLFAIEDVYEGTYSVYAGKWGYIAKDLGTVQIRKDTAFTINLQRGYQDEFFFDFGWQHTLTGNGARGPWTRDEPTGTYFNGQSSNPEFDIEGDIGDECYVTGNVGGAAGTDDVDNGVSTLISPWMDLSEYEDPVLTYYAWFLNAGGSTPPNDSLLIQITNGTDTVVLENITSEESMGAWRPETFFHLKDYLELTNSMRLILTTADDVEQGHLVEAALDFVRVRELDLINSTDEPELMVLPVRAFPNPFREQISLDLRDLTEPAAVQLRAFNQLGQQLLNLEIPAGTGLYDLPSENWAPGSYYLHLLVPGLGGRMLKVIKVR
ncbi:choice-of-anchor B family protein [Flavilitoribacter nigricans]|uniref:Choice-of-anchor B family protein n=1 Tax=Flavilitoribacter nigricans (strain ATCC 23147 / DSM 23189 / NBRC 102662 / NCIMB 1420 / SS-2) TaxID=1122177 RepID=A0A2D0NCD7_FLAN2|nr:choice-of-anchor B family protein [Flavilitoribacter nigricans]PHN06036.1 hypothetical protein CRP01_13785 [Flavilitoribacter nigricans DSM 23189 = NBRC 102662]